MGGLGCLLPTYEKESKQKKQSQSWLFLNVIDYQKDYFPIGHFKGFSICSLQFN